MRRRDREHLHICFFSGGMNRGGGTERMTQLLANALSERSGWKVSVLSKSDKGEPPFYPLSETVSYAVLNNGPYHGVRTIIKEVFLLRRFVRERQVDILVDVDVALGLFSLPLKVLVPRMKQVFWEHFSVGYDADNPRMGKLRRLALRYGDAYVTLTEQDACELSKGRHRAEVTAIPNICSYALQKDGYDITSKVILSAGNLIPIKGFDLALEAASLVLPHHPDWSWHIYGDGSEEKRLRQRAKELGLEESVRFMGRSKSLEAAYRSAALYVLPSRSEGFGLVLAEAKAFRLPTVAFDIPFGPRTIIQDGVNGSLISPFDVQAMAEAILALIEDKALRIRYSEQAQLGMKRFTEKAVVDKWEQLLKGLYGERRGTVG